VAESGRTALDNKTSLLNTPSPRSFSSPRFRDYNPYNYTDAIAGTLDKSGLKGTLFDDVTDGEPSLLQHHLFRGVLCSTGVFSNIRHLLTVYLQDVPNLR